MQTEQAFSTELPIIIINVPDDLPIDSKEEWKENVELKIMLSNREVVFVDTVSIRGRGNITWRRYPKKPYSLRLNKKTSVLGMKPAKRWVLLSNWADRTLLRNNVAFEIARRTSLRWTPQGAHVELILNGVYQGSYYLCEKIQINKNRLNIIEMEASDVDEEKITGGYLLEIDKYFDEVDKFHSSSFHLPYQFKNPKEESLSNKQFEYLEDYINQFETSLSCDDLLLSSDYQKWIDPVSFADWWIINELCYNKEVSRPKSVYIHKQRGERLCMGPVWDFDFSTFTLHDDIYVARKFVYLERLFRSPDFQQFAKHRWMELRPKMLSIPEYIDSCAILIRKSNEQNSLMWPISVNHNGDEQMSFDMAIERMKQCFLRRIEVIDDYLKWFE